ncbi:MAG: type II toxin-antitoxin system VapC family toxin [Beutenbergiaceae bacterium]
MKLVDANVLIYAVNSAAPHHRRSREWLDWALSGKAVVGFSWVPLLAFWRITTHPALLQRPLSAQQAGEVIAAWLGAPAARLVHPTAEHPRLLRTLLADTGVGGNLINDAHLAALAMEHRAQVVTFDTDFARFANVSWQIPPERD